MIFCYFCKQCIVLTFNIEKVNPVVYIIKLLFISVIPSISIKPQKSVFVKEGEKLQLECSNDGNDLTATTVWIRKKSHTILTYNELLTFTKVDRLDAGLYICRVKAVAGDFTVQATVVVHCECLTLNKLYLIYANI